MGLGVIYYYKEYINYGKFPLVWFWMTSGLLFVDAIIRLLIISTQYWPSTFSVLSRLFIIETMRVLIILWCVDISLHGVWYILAFKFYSVTKKKILAVPDIEYKNKLMSAFKRTVLVIWTMPFIVVSVYLLVWGGLFIYQAIQDMPGAHGPFATRPELFESYYILESGDWAETYDLGLVLCEWVEKALTMGAIYWIWVKSNTRPTMNRKTE